jgi:predicted protein tyrosine phosphatase
MKIYILSRQFLKHLKLHKKYDGYKTALISITDPGSKPAVHPLQNFDYKLSLSFYDVEQNRFDKSRKVWYNTITDEDVKQIYNLVKAIKDYQDIVLVVQCEAGISRSAAIAAAVSQYVNGDNKWIFNKFFPNMNVYSKVLERLMI